MTLEQIRTYALSLPEAMEQPHFDRTSFRVRGKIFATARESEPYIHVFVDESVREPALAMHPEWIEKLFWGHKVVGLRIDLGKAQADALEELLLEAWKTKAPKALAQQAH